MVTLYVGLTDLPLGDRHIDLGDGIFLRGADATFISSLLLVNTDEHSKQSKAGPLGSDGLPPLPRPAFWQLGGKTTRISAELAIPSTVHQSLSQQYALARFLGSLLRLWTNPGIRMHAMSEHPFTDLIRLDGSGPRVIPLESFKQHSRLGLIETSSMLESVTWVQANWRAAHKLYSSSTEFRLAADALDAAHFIENEALALVSLWAAMEALFSPSTTELKFRVSALIASFLEEPGEARRSRQKAIGHLYDKRSAAAHGKPKHQSEDLVSTFELLRRVLIKMIHSRAVPSKDELDARLFGC
ncbi:HEPN domain-containing protein [Paucibacter sp. M5-1]|uniref:HEPN domain-containing protein n=1 Tax=Paucibacter sp. M5-1 TaxID=3015998 RepID=UPI0022B8D67E|nr:HEPN domain-containing protein [Paucibacter sp. M5-1]MCZ7884968.1 HEPN domain-containing protein [Paucibacter sp. M5-1]